MNNAWPKIEKEIQTDIIDDMTMVCETIRAMRNLRVEAHVAPSQKVDTFVLEAQDNKSLDLLNNNIASIRLLAKAENISFMKKGDAKPHKSLATVLDKVQIYLPVGDLLDIDKELTRLEQEEKKLEQDIVKNKNKLSNKQFVERAPKEVIEKTTNDLAENEKKLSRIHENIENLAN